MCYGFPLDGWNGLIGLCSLFATQLIFLLCILEVTCYCMVWVELTTDLNKVILTSMYWSQVNLYKMRTIAYSLIKDLSFKN